MKNNLKERYIYAVTRHLPARQQADVARELGGLISEMMEERSAGNNTFADADIKDVLNELGPPEELALKYCGDRRTALISGTYYLMYVHVLRIVLPIVIIAVIGLSIIGMIFGNGDWLDINILFVNITPGGGAVLQMFASAISAGISAFAIITIIFAVMDYKKTSLRDGDMVANLPEMPDAKSAISPFESIFGIIFSIGFVVVLLGYPHIIIAWFDGQRVPVFDIAVLHSLWLPIVFWGILGVVSEIAILAEGRYTIRVAVVTVVANILIAMCSIAIFSNNNLMNPEFIGYVQSNFGHIGFDLLPLALTQVNLAVLGIILITLAGEAISAVVKAFLARR